MDRSAALPTGRVPAGTMIAQAKVGQATKVTVDSPALDVMTDLTVVKAATTGPSTTLRQAEQAMIHQGVRMLLVVREMPLIDGLVTTTDLHGAHAMRISQQRNIPYDELRVADVMTSLAELDAIDYEMIKIAAVSNVIATLQRAGRNHLLVVERATAETPRRVRGVISRAQVERQLGTPVQVTEVANTFAEVAKMLS
jgi:CBS-domain-containing membrane protein